MAPEYAAAIMDGDTDGVSGLSPQEAFADAEATALVSEFVSTTAAQLSVNESENSFDGITAQRRRLVVEDVGYDHTRNVYWHMINVHPSAYDECVGQYGAPVPPE